MILSSQWLKKFSGGQTPAPSPLTATIRTGDDVEKITKSEAEWQAELTPEQFKVLRKKGTERPFTGDTKSQGEGIYRCAGCGLELFDAITKFESGTGWPSFWKPIQGHVEEEIDGAFGMRRTEVLCARCEGHLGHVFPDGPNPTGLRYCMNAVALQFDNAPEAATPEAVASQAATPENATPEAVASQAAAATEATPQLQKATFGAGCFWGVEEAFRLVPGVRATSVGYIGGTTDNPTYKEVCRGNSGHAEAVQVEYDPTQVSYAQLLEIFWSNHNPTTLNRQGPDRGSQYRSAIFFHTPEQQREAELSRDALSKSGRFKNPIVTEITPAPTYFRAEEYHQQYVKKSGRASCHIG